MLFQEYCFGRERTVLNSLSSAANSVSSTKLGEFALASYRVESPESQKIGETKD